MSTSISLESGEYILDPWELELVYRNQTDLVIDAGKIIPDPSTIVDFTSGSPVILREGKGDIFF